MAEFAALVERIRASFPALVFDRAVLNDDGDDHAVVVLDEAWVFRFPRADRSRTLLFPVELKLLAALDGASPIPIPRYVFVPPARDFGGYALIVGEPLRQDLFAALAPNIQDRVLDDLADLLRVVHALPEAVLAQGDGVIAREWTGEQFRRRWIEERRAPVGEVVGPSLLKEIDRFYDAYAVAPPPPREVVTQGDLTDTHMLLSPDHDRLAGVIDFGDACLGDPSYDFAFFFAWGDPAAEHVAQRYDLSGEDPTLLARALGHFIRFRVEQLRRDAGDGATVDIQAILRDLPGRLQRYLSTPL